MATTKKQIDPLVEELPEPVGPAPESSDDVSFTVLVWPYVANGDIRWGWKIEDHTHKEHIGDYSNGSHFAMSFDCSPVAEADARSYIKAIRKTVGLKLSLPPAQKLEL